MAITYLSDSENIDSIQLQEQASAPATPAIGYGRIYCKSDGLYFIGDDGVEVGPLAAAVSSNGYTQGARVYNSANISIPNNTVTVLTFDSERYDTDTIHDAVSTTSRLTCQTAGKYLIMCNVKWAANNSGLRQVAIKLNGATEIGVNRVMTVTVTSSQTIHHVGTIYDLQVGDYVEAYVYQQSGGALNVESAGNVSPEFMMQRIG